MKPLIKIFFIVVVYFVGNLGNYSDAQTIAKTTFRIDDAYDAKPLEGTILKIYLDEQQNRKAYFQADFSFEFESCTKGEICLELDPFQNYKAVLQKKNYFSQMIQLDKEKNSLYLVSMRPKNKQLVRGNIVGLDKALLDSLDAEVFFVAKDGQDTFSTKINADGSFRIGLLKKDSIQYEAYTKIFGYQSSRSVFSLKNQEVELTPIKIELFLSKEQLPPQITAKVKYTKDDTFALNKFHFQQKTTTLTQDGSAELERLVQLFKDYPELKLEISVHTDTRKSHRYNKILAKKRSKVIQQYLEDNGISKTRFQLLSKGEEVPLYNCGKGVNCSSEQHQANNRLELKILAGEILK